MSRDEPPHQPFDRPRLARIDAFLKERYLDTGKLPHAQLMVARGAEMVHFSSQGAAREGSDKPIDEGSIFRIASMTKPVTSIAFMMLFEEGKVALDTPVHHVIPEFADLGVYKAGGAGVPFQTRPLEKPMRMIDLLRHTSGLTYSFQNRTNVDAAYREGAIERWHGNLTLDEFVGELGKLPLEFQPGSAWNYSVSTDVLGLVVERLAGMKLDRFFEERIFGPLGMRDTFFQVPADKRDRLTDCWTLTQDRGRILYDRGAESAWSLPPSQLSGGGGLASTTRDYHRFAQMCLNGGTLDGARLVSRKTVELMTQNHLPGGSDLASMSRSLFSEANYAGVGFGLGFSVTADPARAMSLGTRGEYSWGGMFSTYFFVDPVERLIMIFMTQLSPSSAYTVRREIRNMVYAALN